MADASEPEPGPAGAVGISKVSVFGAETTKDKKGKVVRAEPPPGRPFEETMSAATKKGCAESSANWHGRLVHAVWAEMLV